MKQILSILVILFTAYCLKAQQSFADSLLKYQHKYKVDLSSIIKNDTGYVRFFPTSESYTVTAKVEKLKSQKIFGMPASNGSTRQAQKIITVSFKLNGQECTLHGYQLLSLRTSDQYQDHFFIPFTDKTSGTETYEGGRYLDFKLGDIRNGNLTIDFNKAYNPYCAFTTGYACPIPPNENALAISVYAGEMKFMKPGAH